MANCLPVWRNRQFFQIHPSQLAERGAWLYPATGVRQPGKLGWVFTSPMVVVNGQKNNEIGDFAPGQVGHFLWPMTLNLTYFRQNLSQKECFQMSQWNRL